MYSPGWFVRKKSVGMYHKNFLWASEKSKNVEAMAEKNPKMNKMKRTGSPVTRKRKTKPNQKKAVPYLVEKGCSHPLNDKKVAKLLYVVLKTSYVDIIFPLCWLQFC